MSELVTKADLQAGLALLQSQLDGQTLRLTVRLGGIVALLKLG